MPATCYKNAKNWRPPIANDMWRHVNAPSYGNDEKQIAGREIKPTGYFRMSLNRHDFFASRIDTPLKLEESIVGNSYIINWVGAFYGYSVTSIEAIDGANKNFGNNQIVVVDIKRSDNVSSQSFQSKIGEYVSHASEGTKLVLKYDVGSYSYLWFKENVESHSEMFVWPVLQTASITPRRLGLVPSRMSYAIAKINKYAQYVPKFSKQSYDLPQLEGGDPVEEIIHKHLDVGIEYLKKHVGAKGERFLGQWLKHEVNFALSNESQWAKFNKYIYAYQGFCTVLLSLVELKSIHLERSLHEQVSGALGLEIEQKNVEIFPYGMTPITLLVDRLLMRGTKRKIGCSSQHYYETCELLGEVKERFGHQYMSIDEWKESDSIPEVIFWEMRASDANASSLCALQGVGAQVVKWLQSKNAFSSDKPMNLIIDITIGSYLDKRVVTMVQNLAPYTQGDKPILQLYLVQSLAKDVPQLTGDLLSGGLSIHLGTKSLDYPYQSQKELEVTTEYYAHMFAMNHGLFAEYWSERVDRAQQVYSLLSNEGSSETSLQDTPFSLVKSDQENPFVVLDLWDNKTPTAIRLKLEMIVTNVAIWSGLVKRSSMGYAHTSLNSIGYNRLRISCGLESKGVIKQAMIKIKKYAGLMKVVQQGVVKLGYLTLGEMADFLRKTRELSDSKLKSLVFYRNKIHRVSLYKCSAESLSEKAMITCKEFSGVIPYEDAIAIQALSLFANGQPTGLEVISVSDDMQYELKSDM